MNSETDFVARNDDFQKLVRTVADIAVTKGGTIDQLKAEAYPSGGTVADAITHAVATIGENMTLRRVAEVSVAQGVIGHYVHNAIGDGLGKIGVIVGLQSAGDAVTLATLGRQIAMHVAAASPIALDATAIHPSIVERERNVLMEKNAGKPAHVLDKIVDSGLKTYFKEVSLIDQAYVHDSAKSVAQAIKEAEKTVGAPISLTGFARFALGEGIDKGEASDFASEVKSLI